jgi:hypothetical protein
VEKRRSKEAERQKAEKQNSGEAEKQRSIKAEAGKSRKAEKHKSKEAGKQISKKNTVIPRKLKKKLSKSLLPWLSHPKFAARRHNMLVSGGYPRQPLPDNPTTTMGSYNP